MASETSNWIVVEKLFIEKLIWMGQAISLLYSKLRGLIMEMGLDCEDEISAKHVIIDAIKIFDVKKTSKVSREDFLKGMDQMIQKFKGDLRSSHTSTKIPVAPH